MEVKPYGFIPTDMGEPYGFCMGRRGDAIYLMPNNKDGEARQYRVVAGPQGPVATLERTLKVASQTEGCVVDDVSQVFYLGEEDTGIWRFDFDPAAPATPTQVHAVDRTVLTDDVEGLTIMRDGGRTDPSSPPARATAPIRCGRLKGRSMSTRAASRSRVGRSTTSP